MHVSRPSNHPPELPRWQFWIDRGGTFTDVIGKSPTGELHSLKLLSHSIEHYPDAAIEGIRRLLGVKPTDPLPTAQIECVKMGTTVATNALLERKGDPTVLVITRGFKDALKIATQARPKVFSRQIVLPESVYQAVIEVNERLSAHGEVLEALDENSLAKSLTELHQTGIDSVAIVLMHAWTNPLHEKRISALAKQIGFRQISVSHQISPLIKLIPRGDTTVVDAYLTPILKRYVDQVQRALDGVPVYFMQSSGGLTDASLFNGKDAILSGPAGGIVGMVRTAQAAGHCKIIGFDMGGTSTDVSHFAQEFERTLDCEIAGVRVKTPMMNIHTVAAGGSSVVHFDGTRLRIGPHSAGSNPGPRAYRKHGPLTITDAQILLGRIQPKWFPQVFGPHANEPLDAQAVKTGFTELAQQISAETGQPLSAVEIAYGCLEIAITHMANAIKKISVAQGRDITQYTLQCFGGAGGQVACQVADKLGMRKIFCHPLGGVLSAYGMGLADESQMRVVSIEKLLNVSSLETAKIIAAQTMRSLRNLMTLGNLSESALQYHYYFRVKYLGTDTSIAIEVDMHSASDLLLDQVNEQFTRQYQQRFAFLMPNRPLALESIAVEARRPGDAAPTIAVKQIHPTKPTDAENIELYTHFTDQRPAWVTAKGFKRDQLADGHFVEGPALIADRHSTIVVEAGWRADCMVGGHIELSRIDSRTHEVAAGTSADPIRLEVFNNLFMNIAEQMGLRLQATANSINIKERLDFSCALFDGQGELIANAPHIPVHLGSMSESIHAVIQQNPQMQMGDVYVLNDPYHGGTHLPDITVVTPVFLEAASKRPEFYVASRGHHADVGGITPGSMPPNSKNILDEGVLLQNVKLVSGGILQEDNITALFSQATYPARNIDQNLADLRAQVAANQKGVLEIKAMVEQFGLKVVQAYMRHVKDNACECVRQAIASLSDGEFVLPLDNGAKICVKVTVDIKRREATIDFTGTSAQLDNNFNAPKSITTAAVLYVFRTLVDDDIPLNAGCLNPLKIIVPEGSMLNPSYPAAVVAGNVETSSAVTNALYGALKVMAASQCTMNNFTFGNATHQYYETIAGGSGAGNGFHGTSVVQTHMTNSRLTDPEMLEWRFPVRVEEFSIRPHSGGEGQYHGGDGGYRRIRFLEPMTVSILSNGRIVPAFGMAGGSPGQLGVNRILRSDGQVLTLSSTQAIDVAAFDAVEILTPGGGGYGFKTSAS